MKRLKELTGKTIHFIGIGGAGMSPLATLLVQMGYTVQGSDLKESIRTIRLKEGGVQLFYDHKPSHLRAVDVVVVSSAISADNSEWVYAKEQNIPVLRRSEMLDQIMLAFSTRVAVCGAHGKTTTSAMAAVALEVAGFSPSYMVGSDILNFHHSAQLGEGDCFIAEADESDGSFLCLNPTVGIVLNLDDDHMDYYRSFDNVESHFATFVKSVIQSNGRVILNRDDQLLKRMMASMSPDSFLDFSIEEDATVKAQNLRYSEEGTRFELVLEGKSHGDIQLKLYGSHYVYDALAVISLCYLMGVTMKRVRKGLESFLGTKRRLQKIGSSLGIDVYDDYAHHPTEIVVTLDALKQSFKRRLVCVFQPHRYSRFNSLYDRFLDCFSDADIVVVTDVYASGEGNDSDLSIATFCDELKKKEPILDVHMVLKKSDVPQTLVSFLKSGDVVVTMGAGDINSICLETLRRLKEVESTVNEGGLSLKS